MDIFVIKIEEDIDCLNFKKKDYSNSKKLKAHCFAYFMLDKILKDQYAISDREIVFENQKPVLKNGQKHFSISHSGEYVALCFSDYECGIDIEKITDRDFEKISQTMNFKADSLDEFYAKWTQYEAQYKLQKEPKLLETKKYGDYYLSVASVNINEEIIYS